MSNYKFDEFVGGEVYDTTTTNRIDLIEMLSLIKYPDYNLIQKIRNVQYARSIGDENLKAHYKSHLPYYTPCVQLSGGRKYDNITGFTGLTILDFDKMKTDMAIEFKYKLFNEFSWIISAWISPSGGGCKFLVSIPIVKSVDEYKTYFYALMDLFEYNHWFDPANKNAVLPLYYGYDPDLLLRINFTTYTDTVELPVLDVVNVSDYSVYVTLSERDEAIQHIINTIKLIQENGPGHHLLRTASFTAGNYAAWGYWSREEAIQLMYNLIEQHPYLRQKKNVYKASAVDGIDYSIVRPTEIKK